ncbi:hypothetical protein ACTP2L_06945, partial [Campylobacter jejuni]
ALGLPGRRLDAAALGEEWEAIRHVCERLRDVERGQRFETSIPLLENWYEVRAVSMGEHFVLLLRDITSRRRGGQSGEEPAAGTLLKTIIDSAADLIFVKDMAGRFIQVNRALNDVS